jgi:hypothetical protein
MWLAPIPTFRGHRAPVEGRCSSWTRILPPAAVAAAVLLVLAAAGRAQPAPGDSAAGSPGAAVTDTAGARAASAGAAASAAEGAEASEEGSRTLGQKLFDTTFFPVFLGLAIFGALFLWAINRAERGKQFFIRKIAGLDAVEEAVGRATEMGKPVLYVPGIDDVNNIQTIYSMIILGNVARTVAQYETPLIVPLARAFVVPLAEETVKQAYTDAGVPDAYNPNNIRYLSEEQFAFTAGVDGIMLREKPAANLFLGSFFAESLILAETGFQTGAIQIAGTANIHQLPFFVVACDYTLIGEEFYAATAYLAREPKLVGTLKGTDYMKVMILAYLVLGTILETFGVHALTNFLKLE